MLTTTGGPTGLGLSLRRFEGVERVQFERETAMLLLGGRGQWRLAGRAGRFERNCVFADRPAGLVAPAGASLELESSGPSEFAIIELDGSEDFAPRWFEPEEVGVEQRGARQWEGTAHREVRTLFQTGPGQAGACGSRIVLGEVANQAGRWSSYPPHHHPQPELYHYRFARAEGYGHAELDEDVVKVRHGDTLVIPPGVTHAQCAAPGYPMWYLWTIRHLDGQPYEGPTFDPSHRWLLRAD